MNVVLTHPIHGAKVAIHEQEMVNDLKNGWTVQPDIGMSIVAPTVESEPVVEPAPVKRGRPRKQIDDSSVTNQTLESVIDSAAEVPAFLNPANPADPIEAV